METKGIIKEKYEVINNSQFTKQRFKFQTHDNQIMFLTAFGLKRVELLSQFGLDEEVIIDISSDLKESNGKKYTNYYANSIKGIKEINKNKTNYEEFFALYPENVQNIISSMFFKLAKKYPCNLNKFQFFYESINFIKKYGEKKLKENFEKMIFQENIEISNLNHNNLKNYLFI